MRRVLAILFGFLSFLLFIEFWLITSVLRRMRKSGLAGVSLPYFR